MDNIIIKDLLVRGLIGVSDSERAQPQDIVINIILFTDISKAGTTDNIEDCVNYRTVSKQVISLVESSSRHTVEALANDIAILCLKENNAQGVRVRVEKPGAVRFSRSVGVEIERFKSNNP